MSHRLAQWPPAVRNLPTRTRCTICVAIMAPLLLIGVLGSFQLGAPPDSGLAGCTALSGAQHVAASDYPRIRAQFAGSLWPDLRTAGLAYVDLAMQLRKARNTDGYEAVWFYQRLSAACARHARTLDTRACHIGYARHLVSGRPARQGTTARTCAALVPSVPVVVRHCRDQAGCRERDRPAAAAPAPVHHRQPCQARGQQRPSAMLTGPLGIGGPVVLGRSETPPSWRCLPGGPRTGAG